MNKHSQQGKMALVVIDVQKGLFERPTPIYQAQKVLENINILIDRARKADVPVFFIQHSNEKLLVKGSDAWQLHPEIQPLEGEAIIHKLHGDAFRETDLHHALVEKNISVVVMTGLVTHGCVKATSLGALDLGYQVVLVSDGHSSFSKDAPNLIEKWNRTIKEKGAELLETADVDFSG